VAGVSEHSEQDWWIAHDGGHSPDTAWRVTVRTRNGAESGPHRPAHWNREQWVWAEHEPSKADIVGYMIHLEPRPEPEEPQPPAPVDEPYQNLMAALRAFEVDRGVMLRSLRFDRYIDGRINRLEIEGEMFRRTTKE